MNASSLGTRLVTLLHVQGGMKTRPARGFLIVAVVPVWSSDCSPFLITDSKADSIYLHQGYHHPHFTEDDTEPTRA